MYILRTGIIGGYRAPGGLPTTAVTSIPYTQMLSGVPSIHQVAHVGVTYLGQISVSNDYAINWEVIDSVTRIAVVTGTDNQISFTPSESDWGKSFDVRITVVWQGGSLERYLRRGIRCTTYPPFTAGQAGVTQVNVSSHSGFQTTPFATNKIRMIGIRNGGSMILNNLTIPGQNVEIQLQPTTGVPCTFNPGSSNGFKLGYGCHNILINGTSDNTVQYGGLSSPNLGGGDAFNVQPGYSGSSDYTDNITFLGVQGNNGINGFHIEPPASDVSGTYPVTQIDNFKYISCKALNNNTEAFYLGWTRDYEGRAEINGMIIAYCIAETPGWDGIQPGNALGVELHNCQVLSPGQRNNGAQWSGISKNGFVGIIHHNYINDAYNSITGSTGRNHGGFHIFRNRIVSSRTQLTSADYHNWSRLGDGADTSIAPVDLCIYRNEFDTDGYPFETFCQGCSGSPHLNYQYDNNVQLNATYPQPPLSEPYFIDLPYTEHFMAIYDFDGYRVL